MTTTRLFQTSLTLSASLQALSARPIPLAEEWTFSNPEGISTIAKQSASAPPRFCGNVRRSG